MIILFPVVQVCLYKVHFKIKLCKQTKKYLSGTHSIILFSVLYILYTNLLGMREKFHAVYIMVGLVFKSSIV